jgi:hypothetical protein
VPQKLFLNDGARARFAGGIRPIDVRIGIGLAVRKGISRPDISSSEALMPTLLAATAKELRSNRPSDAQTGEPGPGRGQTLSPYRSGAYLRPRLTRARAMPT